MMAEELKNRLEVIDVTWPPDAEQLENLWAGSFNEAFNHVGLGFERKIATASKWNFLRPLINKLKKFFYGEIIESLRAPLERQNVFNKNMISLMELVQQKQNLIEQKIAAVDRGRSDLQKFVETELDFIKNICQRWGQRLDQLEIYERNILGRIDDFEAGRRTDQAEIIKLEAAARANDQKINNLEGGQNSLSRQISQLEEVWTTNWPKVDELGKILDAANQRIDQAENRQENQDLKITGFEKNIGVLGDNFSAHNQAFAAQLNQLENIWQDNWPKVGELSGALNAANIRLDEVELAASNLESFGQSLYQTHERMDGLESSFSSLALDFEEKAQRVIHLENIAGNNWPRVDRLEKFREDLEEHTGRLGKLFGNAEQVFKNWKSLDDKVSLLEEKTKIPSRPEAPYLIKKSADDEKIFSSEYDYLIFEDEFRGDVEKIKEHQRHYLEYFKGCQKVLDIGCGRGEFLKLLKENNIGGFGVDSNEYMVLQAKKSGLKVALAKIPECLVGLKNDSLDGAFVSHFVEHLQPRDLVKLVFQIYEKLKPEAHLIFETVNPLSFYALANFFSDLTHVRPILPRTLEFLAARVGFKKEKFELLSPLPADFRLKKPPADGKILVEDLKKIEETIFGFQDYALIFKK